MLLDENIFHTVIKKSIGSKLILSLNNKTVGLMVTQILTNVKLLKTIFILHLESDEEPGQ